MFTGLNRYSHIYGQYLVNLIPEIVFYLSFVRLSGYLKVSSLEFSKPEIAETQKRECNISDLYNINLALHLLKNEDAPPQEIVPNDVHFDDSARILIITGPNRGGKTVYTQAVGLAQLLFQAGVFVPGSHATMSPVDAIYTHFPVDENQTVELGRLGEETQRLSKIFNIASKYSLILLNESLSSTSFTEGLYIAQDVVKALRYLGVRAIFNTHMHELATYADTINSEVQGESKVISLVTGLINGKRSYKIEPGAPLGKSYAMDIAMKYGMSFEQIVEMIDER
jgi:DNA mismatch repair ATPase MutS